MAFTCKKSLAMTITIDEFIVAFESYSPSGANGKLDPTRADW